MIKYSFEEKNQAPEKKNGKKGVRPEEKTSGALRRERSDWERLEPEERRVLPDGRVFLEWIVDTPPSGGAFEFAFSFPYGPDELERMIAGTSGYWKKDEIGVTRDDHILIRLSNQYGDPQKPMPGLYLMARQHAAEVSGSWVLDGVLRRLAEKS